MKITVVAFGIAREIINNSAVDIELTNEYNVGSLKLSLEEKYPALKKIGSYMIAVNNEYTTDTTMITEKDEVALIPPVSGG